MQPDPEIPLLSASQQVGTVPPVVGASAPPGAASPPPLPAQPKRMRQMFAILLSLGFGLFLADAVVSLADNSLNLLFHLHVHSVVQEILCLFAVLTGIVIYGLMGLTPMIPKRLFLPVTLFNPLAALAMVPLAIYFYDRLQQIGWAIALCQVVFGLGILRLAQGGFNFRWPLVPEKQLAARGFSWLNLLVFLLLNAFVLLPAVIVYLVLCAGLAADHFSDGFLKLGPDGLTVQVRKYARNDGKTIQLFPMAHIGDTDFYRKVSQSFPANSIILLEGVTDNQTLLTNRITYKRMAASLGLSEQQKEFKPSQGELVRADVDVEQFATNTIDFLNLVMRIHSKGLNTENVMELVQYSPPPDFQDRLFEDLLRKRNRRLLEEIPSRLSETDNIIVPWGVAHMPGIAKEIQKSGFRLVETRKYVVIRFRLVGNKSKAARKESDHDPG